jgi:hypothetical protein
MTQRYRERVEIGLIKFGRQSLAEKVAESTGRKKKTVERWLREGPADSHGAFHVALACGADEAEALALARECFQSEAKTA